MSFNTLESTFEYQVKEIIKAYRKATDSTATGEELEAEIWEHKELIGKLFLEHLSDYMELEELDA